MPTLRGWALTGAGLALAMLWILFGDEELLLGGVFFLIASLAAVGYVRGSTLPVRIDRTISPAAVHDGDNATVVLGLSNIGARMLTNVSIVDEVIGLGSAGFEMSRLEPGHTAFATYRVACRPRGVYEVGPAITTSSDPLGLAERAMIQGTTDRLVVYPRVEPLRGFPTVIGQSPAPSTSRPEHSRGGGEDFYTLRSYQRGDDLRRVHWPWSAKTDELMIRQLETPWQSRALVLLDVRASSYESAEAFEKSVSGAASVLAHLIRAGFQADFWDGGEIVLDASRYPTTLERLAVVRPEYRLDLEASASRVRFRGGGGALIIVTGDADRVLVSVQRRFTADYPMTILMSCSSTTPQAIAEFQRLGATTILNKPTQSWAEAWGRAMTESWNAVSPR